MSDLRSLTIDSRRLTDELNQLATFSAAPAPAVTRIVFSQHDLDARAYLRDLYQQAGLLVREDPIGNTFARWVGSQPDLAAVGTGSHTDAIPFSGRYDGTVGVLGGLEAIRGLQQAGFQPRRSVELVMFTSEEPTRFGVGCTGSRALAGVLSPQQLRDLTDDAGQNYDQVRMQAGFHGPLDDVALPLGYYDSFVELHIEQGPQLESRQLPIGIVTAIAAPATLHVELTGEGGHAGAVLMPDRRDTLCAAAEVVLAVEKAARESGSTDTVATTGVLEVHPGAVNSIPDRATMKIDIRDIDLRRRDLVLQAIRTAVSTATQSRGVTADIRLLNADPPAAAAPQIVAAIEHSCDSAGLGHQQMISRAYHDSLFVARISAMGMIFIPCRNGVSHRPDEYASPQQIAAGVEVLARTLAALSHA